MAATGGDQQLMVQESKFVARVRQLPIVISTVQHLLNVYQGTKECNILLKYTLEAAETGVKTVVPSSLPLVAIPVNKLDEIACGQLDKLEQKYPMINEPPEKWVPSGKSLYEDNVKPSVDKVVAVKDFGVNTLAGVTQYGVIKINGVKQLGVSTVTSVTNYGLGKVSDAMHTAYGRHVSSGLNHVLDVTESYLDYYLPEEIVQGPLKRETDGALGTGDDTEKSDEAEKDVSVTRIVAITDKARRRMCSRAIQELKKSLERLTLTVNLIKEAKGDVEDVPASDADKKTDVITAKSHLSLEQTEQIKMEACNPTRETCQETQEEEVQGTIPNEAAAETDKVDEQIGALEFSQDEALDDDLLLSKGEEEEKVREEEVQEPIPNKAEAEADNGDKQKCVAKVSQGLSSSKEREEEEELEEDEQGTTPDEAGAKANKVDEQIGALELSQDQALDDDLPLSKGEETEEAQEEVVQRIIPNEGEVGADKVDEQIRMAELSQGHTLDDALRLSKGGEEEVQWEGLQETIPIEAGPDTDKVDEQICVAKVSQCEASDDDMPLLTGEEQKALEETMPETILNEAEMEADKVDNQTCAVEVSQYETLDDLSLSKGEEEEVQEKEVQETIPNETGAEADKVDKQMRAAEFSQGKTLDDDLPSGKKKKKRQGRKRFRNPFSMRQQ